MPTQNPNYIAGGTILPKTFVTLQTDADLTVEQSAAGDMPIGVSGIGSRAAPIPSVTVAQHALVGEQPLVHGLGEEAFIIAGDTITAGAFLKPDANGEAVVASAGDKYGGRALTAAADGEDCRIFIQPGELET
jgi:hypothetical protein